MRIIVVKARTLIIAALLLLALPVLFMAPRAMPAFSNKDGGANVTDKADTQEKKIALTLECDDSGEGIDDILDTLSEYKTTAAFFVSAKFAAEHPASVKSIFERGHAVGSLCIGSREDLADADRLINAACGATPLYVRLTNRDAAGELADTGKIFVGYSIDSGDYKSNCTEETMLTRLVNTSPGDIIRMHSGSKLTRSLLPKILKGLKKTYEFVPLDELIRASIM